MRRGGRGPVGRNPGLERHDRRRDPAGRVDEPASVLEPLDVQGDAGGGGVGVQPLEAVGEVHVGHVADGNQPVEAHPAVVGGRVDRHEQATALGNQRGPAREGKERGERSVELVGVREDPDDVRAKESHAVAPGDTGQLLLQVLAADLAESRGDDDQGLDALPAALPGDLGAEPGRYGQDGRVDVVGHVENGPIGLESQDLVTVGIDREDFPGVAVGQGVLEDRVADLAGVFRGPDDGDGLRPEEAVEHPQLGFAGPARRHGSAFGDDGYADLIPQPPGSVNRPGHSGVPGGLPTAEAP